jgi:hypothetical protein
MTVGAQQPAELGSGAWRASILTPGDWVELDLDPMTRHKTIRRAVRNAVRHKTVRQPDAVRLIRCLEQIAARAHDGGAFFCASQVVADDPTRDPLVANVTMHVVPYELPGELAFRTPPDMCGWLLQSIRDENDYDHYDDDSAAIVTLPQVGPAVRHEVVARGVVVQYFVPLPVARPTALVMLTFTCPCPPYAELTTKLFDVMAASLCLDSA